MHFPSPWVHVVLIYEEPSVYNKQEVFKVTLDDTGLLLVSPGQRGNFLDYWNSWADYIVSIYFTNIAVNDLFFSLN